MPRPSACRAIPQLPPLPGGATLYTTLCFKASKANAKGLAPVLLRITIAGERAYFSPNIRLEAADWNKRTGKVRESHASSGPYNEKLQQLLGDAVTAKQRVEAAAVRAAGITPGAPATAAEVADYLRDPQAVRAASAPKCYLSFCESELETHYAKGNYGTYKSVAQAVKRLRAWHGRKPLLLDAFTPALAGAFYRHLLATSESRTPGGARATAALKLRWLTALFHRGRKQGVFSQATGPFEAVETPGGGKQLKTRLSQEQVQTLATLPLLRGSACEAARNVYLLQFYLRGERVGATLLLRRVNYTPATGRLLWQAQKGGPQKETLLVPAARALLASFATAPNSPFLLPLLPSDYDTLTSRQQLSRVTYAINRLNKALAHVSKLAGFAVVLRTHSARHTFATLAAKATGHNTRAVQQLLGHAEQRTTEVYLADLDTQELDSMAGGVYELFAPAA